MNILKTLPLITILLMSACNASAGISSAREKFLESTGLSSYRNVSFKDEDGNALTFEQFKKLAQGRSFSMMKDQDASKAIVQIQGRTQRVDSPNIKEPTLNLAAGSPAPKIARPALDGRLIDYTIKPTLISFFFTECAPCIKEIPKINSLSSKLSEVQFASVTFEKVDITRDFVAKYGLKTPVIANEQNFINQIGVKNYPLHILIDKEGRFLGALSGATLQLPSGEAIFTNWVKAKLGA